MNFYDGSEVTPFMPKRKIAQVLRQVINFPLPSEGYNFFFSFYASARC
jgi:hypothetical protein